MKTNKKKGKSRHRGTKTVKPCKYGIFMVDTHIQIPQQDQEKNHQFIVTAEKNFPLSRGPKNSRPDRG